MSVAVTAETPRVPARAELHRLRGVPLVLVLATGLALALRLYELARPNYLLGITGYDDAVDFGSAVRLIHGVVPYRDFTLVQPPGITLLMAPLAALSRVTGTDTAFAVARVLTVCVGAAGVLLVGLLVRHRGVLATVLACGILAVHPDAILASHSVLLEPWLVLFCLLGALAAFDGDELTGSGRRLALGGAAFGFAAAIKVWAILPIVILVALCWRQRGVRSAAAYVAGALAGFAIPVLPFVALAPRSFYDNVVAAQLSRVDLSRVPVLDRLLSLAGLSDLTPSNTVIALACLVIGLFVVVCLVAATRGADPWPPMLEWFALLSSVLIVLAFMWPADYYPHYAGFFAPFLALSVALPAARWVAGRRPRSRPGPGGVPMSTVLTAAAAVAIVAMAAVDFHQEARLKTKNPSTAAQVTIPPGACVLTDMPSYLIIADRFTASDPRCSQMVDSVGTDYALSHGRNALLGAGDFPAVRERWMSGLRRAQYVWLYCAPPGALRCNGSTNRRIPWTRGVVAYLENHFRRLPAPPAYLYVRR